MARPDTAYWRRYGSMVATGCWTQAKPTIFSGGIGTGTLRWQSRRAPKCGARERNRGLSVWRPSTTTYGWPCNGANSTRTARKRGYGSRGRSTGFGSATIIGAKANNGQKEPWHGAARHRLPPSPGHSQRRRNSRGGGGAYGQAKALGEKGLTFCRELGERETSGVLLRQLGTVALRQGDYRRAMALFDECLNVAGELADK